MPVVRVDGPAAGAVARLDADRQRARRPGRAPTDRSGLPAGDRVLRRVRARPARLRAAGRPHLRRGVPVLLVVLRRVLPPRRRRTSTELDRRPRARPVRRSSSRSRATTATCCATSSPPASGRSASTRRRARRRPPRRSACRRSSASSASSRRRRSRAEHGPADVIVANNVMAHVPDLNDFVGGFADAARRRRRADGREPVRARPGRARRVRHDLPRALLLLLVLVGRRADGAPRAAPQRRRVLPRPARRHAALARRHATPTAPTRCRQYLDAERDGGHDRRSTTTPRFAERVRTCQDELRALLDDLRDAGPHGRRLRCGRQGRDAAQQHRDRHRPGRLRRRPQRAQAGQADARMPAADPAGRGAASRTDPTTCCCWRGTSPTRSSPSSAAYAAAGGTFYVPVPSPHRIVAADRLSVRPVERSIEVDARRAAARRRLAGGEDRRFDRPVQRRARVVPGDRRGRRRVRTGGSAGSRRRPRRTRPGTRGRRTAGGTGGGCATSSSSKRSTRRNVGDHGRVSTTWSTIVPRAQRTSFASPAPAAHVQAAEHAAARARLVVVDEVASRARRRRHQSRSSVRENQPALVARRACGVKTNDAVDRRRP